MKQFIEILPDAFVVEVEAGANSFDIVKRFLLYKYEAETMPMQLYKEIALPEGKWQFLGTCTKDEISFDVEPPVYEKYRHNDCINKCASYPSECLCEVQNKYLSQQLFRSLLLKHNLYWGKEKELWTIPKFDYKIFPGGKLAAQKHNNKLREQYEQNKLQGILVVIKKVK